MSNMRLAMSGGVGVDTAQLFALLNRHSSSFRNLEFGQLPEHFFNHSAGVAHLARVIDGVLDVQIPAGALKPNKGTNPY